MRILPLPTLKTALALILLVVLAAAGYSAWYALSPLSVSKLPVEVEVPLGTGFRAAVDQLERAGVAIHRREFELLARALGQDRDIKAGSYEIAVPLTPVELLDKLTRGDVAQAEVRLIEGWTFAQNRAADRHAAADGPHCHLRPGRRLRRQPEEEAPSGGRALQHVHARRLAADADRHAGPRFAEVGAAPGEDRVPVLRFARRRLQPLLPQHRRAQPRGQQVPARRPMSMRGKFVTLEGVDGAGKSTHAEFVADSLGARGHHVVVTREPGGTDLAEQLRTLILRHPMQPLPETLLLLAARADHVARVILPALEAGHWVACDRFSDATAAYQGAGKGVSLELVERLSAAVHPGLRPDRTLVFDCTYDVARQRLAASGKPLDRFEREDRAFFERVRGAYLARAKSEPARVRVIDASREVAAVREAIETHLADL